MDQVYQATGDQQGNHVFYQRIYFLKHRLNRPGLLAQGHFGMFEKGAEFVVLRYLVDEGQVPDDFWRPQPPKLDRQGLISALKAGREVPGAVLGNGGMTISVRTK